MYADAAQTYYKTLCQEESLERRGKNQKNVKRVGEGVHLSRVSRIPIPYSGNLWWCFWFGNLANWVKTANPKLANLNLMYVRLLWCYDSDCQLYISPIATESLFAKFYACQITRHMVYTMHMVDYSCVYMRMRACVCFGSVYVCAYTFVHSYT